MIVYLVMVNQRKTKHGMEGFDKKREVGGAGGAGSGVGCGGTPESPCH
jgi:hypothetical protein